MECLGEADIKVDARISELVTPSIPVVGELRSLENPPANRVRVAEELKIPPVGVNNAGGLFDEGCGCDFVAGRLLVIARIDGPPQPE